MKKILAFDFNPIIKTYGYFAYYFGMLKAYRNDIYPIISKYFLLLDFIPFTGQVNFQKKAKLKKYYYAKHLIYNTSNITRTIEQHIDNDEYVVITLNDKEFGVPLYKYKGNHDWMIYGYDQEKQIFYLAGYLYNKKYNMFGKLEITYANLVKAIPTKLTSIQKHRISFDHCFSYRKWNEPCQKINFIFLLNFLFIHLNVFPFLIIHNYLYAFTHKQPYKRKFLDLRDIRIIYEQTKAYSLFIKINIKNSNVLKQLQGLEHHSENVLNIASKYHLLDSHLIKFKISTAKQVNRHIKIIYLLELKLIFVVLFHKGKTK